MRNFPMRMLGLFVLLFTTAGYADDVLKKDKFPTVIVTCASGELGGAIAKKLAADNNLILTGRNTEKLFQLQKELRSRYALSYEIAPFDYCDLGSIVEFENFLKSRKTEISGFVLLTPRPKFCSSIFESEANWMNLFQATFTGPIQALKSVLPHFGAHGKIVIIAGTTSVQLMPEYGPACIIRRMWTTCAKALAHQLGPKGVSVNALSPGVVLTDFHVDRITKSARQNGMDYDSQMKTDVAKIPLGRHAAPDEVAKSVSFLLSKDADFINGVNLVLDGGLTLSYQ
jgi:3-oxoacyl-[acyl-carrier protein] reductase